MKGWDEVGKGLIFYDIEVGPARGYFYPPLYQTNILEVDKYQPMMSISWAIFNGEKLSKIYHMQSADFVTFKDDRWDDEQIVRAIHTVFMNTDALPVAHNGDNFDAKMINTFFLKHGLDPLPPERSIDTLKSARRHFRFASNKLDEIAKELGIEGKSEVRIGQIWKPYLLGEYKKVRRHLKVYNNQDVTVLYEIYLKMRPFIKNHPNMAVSGDAEGCPKCGSHERDYLHSPVYTNTMAYRRLRCLNCRTVYRERLSDKDMQNKPEYV